MQGACAVGNGVPSAHVHKVAGKGGIGVAARPAVGRIAFLRMGRTPNRERVLLREEPVAPLTD